MRGHGILAFLRKPFFDLGIVEHCMKTSFRMVLKRGQFSFIN